MEEVWKYDSLLPRQVLGRVATGEEEVTSVPLEEWRAAREEPSRRTEEEESGSPATMFSSEATGEVVCLSENSSSSSQVGSSFVVMPSFASSTPRVPFSSWQPRRWASWEP